MAQELRGILGSFGFVRRDRHEGALFVSDFPARNPGDAARLSGILKDAGWETRVDGGLCRINFTHGKARAFLASLPAREPGPGLAAILCRHARETRDADGADLRRAVKMFDGGNLDSLSRMAGNALAVALRQKERVPGFYAALLLSEEGFA